jgi:hypothetical protein
MSASIPIPFALGEQLWCAAYDPRETWITCPECDGTRAIEMIKGNGERVSLECGHCSHGYEPPRGKVKQCVYESRPIPFVPLRVATSGDEFTYSESPPGATSYSFRYAKDLFRSREECEARCAAIDAERKADDEKRAVHNLASKRRSLAFSASYWSRKVADIERELATAKARLAVCKVKPVKDAP